MKVRASPKAVGVRVLILNFVCCGDSKKLELSRDRVGLLAGLTTPAALAVKWKLYGVLFSWPLFSTFVVVGAVFGLPPLKKYSMFVRTSPPTRSEVSVPGIRNERGKLPPTRHAPAVGAGGEPWV